MAGKHDLRHFRPRRTDWFRLSSMGALTVLIPLLCRFCHSVLDSAIWARVRQPLYYLHTMADQKKTRRELLETFVAQKPDDAFSRYGLAMECMNTGDAAAAEGNFRELLQRNADYVPAYLMYAQMLAKESRCRRRTGSVEQRHCRRFAKPAMPTRCLKWNRCSTNSNRCQNPEMFKGRCLVDFGRSICLRVTLLCFELEVTMAPVRLPLFPLNVVLLPGADMPLHIFEPRYRQMVRDCLETKSPFGMLLALPNGVAGTGCTAEILEVTKRYEDGRCDISPSAANRFASSSCFPMNRCCAAK